MTISGNQPYFIPYVGYWQLINAVDIFEIGDDYNYIKNGWINRNQILYHESRKYLTLPIKGASSHKLINDHFISNLDEEKISKLIQSAYGKTPYFEQGYQLLQSILTYPDINLSEFLFHSISVICDYLEIKTKLIKTSSLQGNAQFKREHRIYDQCTRLGANTYINAIGGMELYDFKEFRKRGITLKFLKTKPIEYKQFNHPFVPNLSILDIIMFNSREEVIKMLDCYDLIGE